MEMEKFTPAAHLYLQSPGFLIQTPKNVDGDHNEQKKEEEEEEGGVAFTNVSLF